MDQLLLSGEKSQQNYKVVQLKTECVLSCKSEKCLVELLINTAWFYVFCVHPVRGLMFKHVACVSAFINFLFFSIKIYMRFFVHILFHDWFSWNLCGMTFVKTIWFFFLVKKWLIDVGNHKHCFKYILIRNINEQLSCTLLWSHVRLKLWGGKRKSQCLPWQQEELPNMTVPKPYQ